MASEEMDAEEFLGKLDELKEKLPYEEYRELESQLSYGLVDHAQKIRGAKRKKRALLWIFVYLPILILLIIFVPQLVFMWLILIAIQLVIVVVQQVGEAIRPPRLY
jgi:hypothetical protein